MTSRGPRRVQRCRQCENLKGGHTNQRAHRVPCLCIFYALQVNFPNHATIVHIVGKHRGRAGGGEEVEQEGDEELEQRGREESKEQLPPTREGKEQEEEESFCFGQNWFTQTETELTFKLLPHADQV